MILFGTDLLCGWSDYFTRSQNDYCVVIRCLHLLCLPLFPLEVSVVSEPPAGIFPVCTGTGGGHRRVRRTVSKNAAFTLFLKLWLFAWLRIATLGLLHRWRPLTSRSDTDIDNLFRSCGIEVTVFSVQQLDCLAQRGDCRSVPLADSPPTPTAQKKRIVESLTPLKEKLSRRAAGKSRRVRRDRLPSKDELFEEDNEDDCRTTTGNTQQQQQNHREEMVAYAPGIDDDDDVMMIDSDRHTIGGSTTAFGPESIENVSLTAQPSLQGGDQQSKKFSLTNLWRTVSSSASGTPSTSFAARCTFDPHQTPPPPATTSSSTGEPHTGHSSSNTTNTSSTTTAEATKSSDEVYLELIRSVGSIHSTTHDAASCIALANYMVRRGLNSVTLFQPTSKMTGEEEDLSTTTTSSTASSPPPPQLSVVEVYLLALKRDEKCIPAMVRLAECMHELDRLELAVRSVDASSSASASSSSPSFMKSLDRTSVYSAILALDARQSTIWNTLGLLLQKSPFRPLVIDTGVNGIQREVNALDCFVAAVEADPESVEALNNLAKSTPAGYTVSINGETLSATSIALRAIRIEPKNPTLYATLASIMTPSQTVNLPQPTRVTSAATATATPQQPKRKLDQHQVLIEAMDIALDIGAPVPLAAVNIARAVFLTPHYAQNGMQLPSGRVLKAADLATLEVA